jgi:hypothetical protein
LLQTLTASTLLLASTLCLWPTPGDAAAQRDIIVLVDQSASAYDEATEGFLAPGLGEFLQDLPADSQIAVFTFAAQTHSLVPLGPLSPESRKRIAQVLAERPAGERRSNSAIALERAIYELKHKGRNTADKAILFLGSALIDTGDPAHDTELSDWIRGDLIAEAIDARIQVFWIVPTERADFPLIQSLTHKSGGAYFRAATREDFQAALATLGGSAPVSAGASTGAAEQPSGPGWHRLDWHSLPWPGQTPSPRVVWSGVIALGALGAMLILWRLRRDAGDRRMPTDAGAAQADHASHALLRDPSGFTGTQAHELTDRPTQISRRPGPDSTASQTIVISDTAISRKHALIEHRIDGYWVTDLGSVNGTYVNDQRISGEQRLQNGDIVRFARYEFEFVLTEPRPMGKTIFAKSRFLKGGRQPAQAAGESHTDTTKLPGESADLGEEVTLLRPKK